MFCPNPIDVLIFGLCLLFYQSRISKISVLASTRENGIPHFLHTHGTIYYWETGVHISAFNKVLLQLKLHWVCDFFLIYSTIYLASPNKKSTGYKPKKMTGAEYRTHTQHTTHHTKTRWAAASLPPVALPYISMATSAMAPNHGAAAPHESVAGAWWWLCSHCGWFPWLGCRMKMHQKIERGTDPCP